MRETTALGAALAAGYAVGIWKDFRELKDINRDDRTSFRPRIDDERREVLYKTWERAVEKSKGWVLDDDYVDN